MNRHRFWYLVRDAIPKAIREMRWAYQRAFHGHDETLMWCLEDYLATLIPDIEKFCKEELADTATPELSPERYKIFTETLRLIGEWRKTEEETYSTESKSAGILWGHIGKNVGYFWD